MGEPKSIGTHFATSTAAHTPEMCSIMGQGMALFFDASTERSDTFADLHIGEGLKSVRLEERLGALRVPPDCLDNGKTTGK